MDLVNELNKIISLDLEEFKAFIKNKLQTDKDKDYLERLFWLPKGPQMTVLNYLIEQHQEIDKSAEVVDSSTNLLDKIDFVLALTKDANIGEPLHQAISTGKTQLALHLLQADAINCSLAELISVNVLSALSAFKEKAIELANTLKNWFNIDQRDGDGRTLISLALNSRVPELLIGVLVKNPNIHAATNLSNANVKFQPIHQAVVLDYADGVRLLAQEDADLSNPMGVMKDTPVLLAARLGKIKALEALVEFSEERLQFEAENIHYYNDSKLGHTAIEELCERIANNDESAGAMRGVAILLCRGAEPPRNEIMRNLLSSNRVELLKAVHRYLEDKPELVDAFVNRCHLTESALHYIVYADHSWGSSIRHLFGKPSDSAFLLEDLVVRKYSNTLVDQGGTTPLPTTATANLATEKNPLKLYAEFVRRYNQAYENQLLPNRWSTMRWMIAEGKCDWATVVRYSETNPTSRTRIIYREMFNPIPAVNDDVESQQDKNESTVHEHSEAPQSATFAMK